MPHDGATSINPSMSLMPRLSHLSRVACAGLFALCMANQAQAVTFCVFDPTGTAGDAYGMTRDYAVAMQRSGVDIQLRALTDESVAIEEFRVGTCDMVATTAFRTRPFNPVIASIDTFGSAIVVRDGRIDIPGSYEVLRKLIYTFSTSAPQVNRLMVNGNYEVGGVLPIGMAYLMSKDRRINSMEALVGKRITALSHDPAQALAIRSIKAVPVPSDIENIASRLSTGAADAIAAPAVAYKPLGLNKALGDQGMIARFPIMPLTYQMVFRRDKLPANFGEISRAYWGTQFDRAMQIIRKAEADIPLATWLDIKPEDLHRYALVMRDIRIDLAQQGVYSKRGLKIIKRVRCRVNPSDPECSTQSEEVWTKPASAPTP
jgi:ABC-type amino acid transport substrate-binding protein